MIMRNCVARACDLRHDRGAMLHTPQDIARIQGRIVEGDLRVSEQIARIERMIEKDYDVAEAKELLRQLETILDQWYVRRQLILDSLNRDEDCPNCRVPD